MDTDIVDLALSCYRTSLEDKACPAVPMFLPKDMNRLLMLANGLQAVLAKASARTDAQPDELRDAARFLILQLCFIPSAGHYRVLGLPPDASSAQIKEHYRLLMQLFHPDRTIHRKDETEYVASRINAAWAVLSSSESRVIYDNRMVRPQRPYSINGDPCINLPRRGRSMLMFSGMALGGAALLLLGLSPGLTAPTPFTFNKTASADNGPVINQQEYAAKPFDRRHAVGQVIGSDNLKLTATEVAQIIRSLAQPTPDEKKVQLVQVQEERTDLERQTEAFKQTQAVRIRIERELKAEQVEIERRTIESERAQAKRSRIENESKAVKAGGKSGACGPVASQEIKKLKHPKKAAKDSQIALQSVKQTKVEYQSMLDQTRATRIRIDNETTAEGSLTKPTAAPANTIPSTRPIHAESPPPDIARSTEQEAQKLLERYKEAYQRCDLLAVMSLLAIDARSNGRDRHAIRRNFAGFFKTMFILQLEFHDLRWDHRGDIIRANGHYELRLKRRDDGKPILSTGNIRFDLRKLGGRVTIQAIDYDWVVDKPIPVDRLAAR